MATLTDRQGHVIATIDDKTGAFTWEARDLAPQAIRDLFDEPTILTMTGGIDADGRQYSKTLELARGTPEWAKELKLRVPLFSDDEVLWQD